MGGFYGLKAAPEAGFAAMALLCPASEAVMLAAIRSEEESRRPAGDPQQTSVTHPAEAPANPPSKQSTQWHLEHLREYFEQQDSLVLAGLVTCPVLLVHARGDEVVPFSHSAMLVQNLGGETTLLAVPKGSHTSAQHDPKIHHRTLAWLKERPPTLDQIGGPVP